MSVLCVCVYLCMYASMRTVVVIVQTVSFVLRIEIMYEKCCCNRVVIVQAAALISRTGQDHAESWVGYRRLLMSVKASEWEKQEATRSKDSDTRASTDHSPAKDICKCSACKTSRRAHHEHIPKITIKAVTFAWT